MPTLIAYAMYGADDGTGRRDDTGPKAQTTLADAGYFAGSHLAECSRRGQQRGACRSHDNGSSKTRTTRTDSSMTSRATALRCCTGADAMRSSAYSMRTESHCDCTAAIRRRLPSVPGLQSLYKGQGDWAKSGHRAEMSCWLTLACWTAFFALEMKYWRQFLDRRRLAANFG